MREGARDQEVAMGRKRQSKLFAKEAVEFLNHVIEEKPLLPFLVPLGFLAWAIERWLVPFSNWIPLAFAVWATIEVGWILLALNG